MNTWHCRLWHLFHLIAGVAFAPAVLCFFCSGKQPSVQSHPAPPAVVIEKFIPPSDSAISSAQIRAWVSSSRLLDTLSSRTRSSFLPEASAEMRTEAEKFFRHAQDSICASSGLHGGYAEYRWIAENIYRESNRRFLDSLSTGLK